jgi:predicted dienelactone hydrolase
MRKFLLSVLLAALVLVPTLAQDEGPQRTGFRPDAPPYAIRGPHPVGFMTFDDGAVDRPINGAIWYPAIQPEGVEEAIVYDHGIADLAPSPVFNEGAGRAFLEAAPNLDGGPYPLVISSHGLGGPIFATAYLHEQLASHGFVVVAPNHPDNTFRDQWMVNSEDAFAEFVEATFESMVMRPMDISQTIDYAEALTGPDGAMAGVIDMEHIGVIGYSFGGYTALAAVGGQLDFSGMPALCESGVPTSLVTNWMCMFHAEDLPDLEARLLEVAGIEAEPGQMWPSFADERIDAIVPLAPGGGSVVISDEGYAGIVTPMMIVRTGGDTLAVPAYNANRAWEFSDSSLKLMVTLEGADHYLIGQCPPDLADNFPGMFPLCSDPVWDTDRAHDLINHFATAFLLAELKGDEDARAALALDAVNFPGIGYETVGY